MEELLKNKKVIVICLFLIILVFVIYLISTNDNDIKESNTEDYQYLKRYNSNEYVPVYFTEEDVVKKYLNEYKNNMLYDVEEAYNSLNKEYREIKFKNLDGYKKYISDFISTFTYSMEVEKYAISYVNSNKLFNIYDNSGNQYIFKEISIMNYEIYLDEYTVEIK